MVIHWLRPEHIPSRLPADWMPTAILLQRMHEHRGAAYLDDRQGVLVPAARRQEVHHLRRQQLANGTVTTSKPAPIQETKCGFFDEGPSRSRCRVQRACSVLSRGSLEKSPRLCYNVYVKHPPTSSALGGKYGRISEQASQKLETAV